MKLWHAAAAGVGMALLFITIGPLGILCLVLLMCFVGEIIHEFRR